MLALLTLREWLVVACATILLLAFGLAYLLIERRRLFAVRRELMVQHRQRLYTARDLQDSLLQCLHILVLRFHCAAENVRADDPAKLAILEELKKADIVIVEARTHVEDLTASADAGIGSAILLPSCSKGRVRRHCGSD